MEDLQCDGHNFWRLITEELLQLRFRFVVCHTCRVRLSREWMWGLVTYGYMMISFADPTLLAAQAYLA